MDYGKNIVLGFWVKSRFLPFRKRVIFNCSVDGKAVVANKQHKPPDGNRAFLNKLVRSKIARYKNA